MLKSIKQVNKIKEKYPIGTIIKMVAMEDIHFIPHGTIGVVKKVDDQGQLHVNWENGRNLAIIPDIDYFIVIK